MDGDTVDLINLNVENTDGINNFTSPESNTERGRHASPDLRRVYLTEIQYYRNPNHVPVYIPDDFIRDSDSARYRPFDEEVEYVDSPSICVDDQEIVSSSQYVDSVVQKSGSTSSNDEPPPLPPKRTKSKSESDLRQRLRDAGVIVDEDSTQSSDDLEVTSPKPLRPISFESRLTSKSDSLARQLDLALTGNMLVKNLDEFEQDFFKAPVIADVSKSTNPFRAYSSASYFENIQLKELSTQDLLKLETNGDIETKKVSFVEVEDRPKPPPRPPIPKSNRFSCPPVIGVDLNEIPDEKAIFFSDGLFQKAEERNEEAIAFCTSVTDIRKHFKHGDYKTNPGYVSPPIIKNNALRESSIDVTVYLEPFPESKTFNFVLSSTANEIVGKCIGEFYGTFNDLDILADQYVLKVVGFTMYLDGEVELCDYIYTQDSVKHGENLTLSLIRRCHMNVELSRDLEDDEDDCRGIYFEHFFNVPSSLSVSEQGLYILLDTYNAEAAKLIEEVSRTFEAQYVPDRIVQVVKAISNALAKVELIQIHEAVNLLLALKNSKILHRTYTQGNKKEHRNYNEYLNPIHFDKGRFHLALQKLTSGVYSLIELYCKSFQTEFALNESKQQELVDVYERIDPRTLTDNFTIRLSSVHRLPADWKFSYGELLVEVGLYYGGNLICPLKRSKKSKICVGFFEHARFDELLEFDIAVKKIPRESKIGYMLYGVSPPKKGTDGRTLLGWFTVNVYDYQGFLLTGSRLFGLLHHDVEFNPVATCATNYIQRLETVIAKVDLQLYYTEVIFPQPVLMRLNTQNGKKEELNEKEIRYITTKLLLKDPMLLSHEEKHMIWSARFALNHLPSALIYVLVSAPSWDSENVLDVHTVLSYWARLSPHDALELLQADYPDEKVRETAVFWLSEISDGDLCDYLPEMVQALKYEAYHNSTLAQFLIRRSLANPRIAHFLFWHMKYYTGDIQFSQRFQIVLSGLLSVCGVRLRAQLSSQDKLIVSLSEVAARVKESKDSVRSVVLRDGIRKLNEKFDACIRLPLEPGLKISHILPESSSYFASNAVPLKVAYKNVDPRGQNVNAIFKMGDDLRKDLVTQLMFGVMCKLWLSEGLDLKMMLYNVLPTGPLTGLIEIVPNAVTFREIHVQHGLTGSFKDDSLALWLQRYNSSEEEYHKAVENFTSSAAGYCVATYLLGIGDRHNDNIMLTKKGYLFHIDFSKFMGELQKFGSIKRDRVPFVLTPDMAYVINNGVTSTQNFQKFIEHCCNAFNIIRRNKNLVLNLLGLMVFSGIPYLSCKEDLSYVREALQLHLTDEEATMFFTRLIENSLSSRATQLNFFIHNVAQMKNATETILRSSRSSPQFSFSNKVHSIDEDGELTSARVVDFQKRYIPDKHYVFVLNITRDNNSGPRFVFRRFEDFQELHAKLSYIFNVFSGEVLPELPPKIIIGRSQIRDVSVRRRGELDRYLVELSNIERVWKSEIVYTFLHSYIKDVEEERRFAEFVTLLQDGRQSRVGGKIKLSMLYKNNQFRILVMHASNLVPRRLQSLANAYVKLYLLPDPMKQTKRKTKVCRKSLNPTYNETLVYDLSCKVLEKRVLQITVWDNDSMFGNEFLGGLNVYLSTLDLKAKQTNWHNLTDLGGFMGEG